MSTTTVAATLERQALADARTDRLNYAQVREDPLLEIEAIQPTQDDTVVVISSGGCTALSLLAAGAGCVIAVDQNMAQNHLVELKATAVARLAHADAVAFLGGSAIAGSARITTYGCLRYGLSPAARAYWDTRPDAIGGGVIDAGVTERFIKLVMGIMRAGIHPSGRIQRLLACRTLPEQQDFYQREWDNRRWRAMFRILLNRWALDRVYEPAYFEHLENPSFAEHFRTRAEHTLTQIPIWSNYFVHQMLTGVYPAGIPDGLPPYLSEQGATAVGSALDRLQLVDGTYTACLRECPDSSVDAFVVSNICEWLAAPQIDELFTEIVRTATPNARLCFRNFVGWTEVPERWRGVVREDRTRGEALMRGDRSVVQRRFAICHIDKSTA
jgi:S-adenosylmethionine-diacylglycerol 3-amino-3-carboxypropyl transferase